MKLFEPWMAAGAIDREAGVARMLTVEGVPAPALLGTLEVDGRRGLVFERLTGDTMIVHMRRAPWSIPAQGRSLARMQAAISAHPAPTLVPLVDVVVAQADGSGPRVVVHGVTAGNPIWSPDGRWLSYSAGDDHAYVVPVDGSAADRLGAIRIRRLDAELGTRQRASRGRGG